MNTPAQKQVVRQGLGVEQLALECRIGPGNHRCLTRSTLQSPGDRKFWLVEVALKTAQTKDNGQTHRQRGAHSTSASEPFGGLQVLKWCVGTTWRVRDRDAVGGQPNRDVMGPLTNTTQ